MKFVLLAVVMLKLPLAGCMSMLWGIFARLEVGVMPLSIPATSTRTCVLRKVRFMGSAGAVTLMFLVLAFIMMLLSARVMVLPDSVPLA